jgi:hypothetical protein
MRSVLVIGMPFAVLLLGVLLELVNATQPDVVDSALTLAAMIVLGSLVVGTALALASRAGWQAVMIAAAGAGAVAGFALTVGLYLPFALSIGSREPGNWLPGEATIVTMVIWGSMIGGVLGLACGGIVVVVRQFVHHQLDPDQRPDRAYRGCNGLSADEQRREGIRDVVRVQPAPRVRGLGVSLTHSRASYDNLARNGWTVYRG